jgi:hypothetical protein
VFRLCTAAEADDRVRFARDCAGDRADTIEWHALVQPVLVTDDRHKAAADLAEQYRGTMTVHEPYLDAFAPVIDRVRALEA